MDKVIIDINKNNMNIKKALFNNDKDHIKASKALLKKTTVTVGGYYKYVKKQSLV